MTQSSSVEDRALEGMEGDLLDRAPFVKSLVSALVVEQDPDIFGQGSYRATGYVVGLTGEWGLGKSSILAMTAQELGKLEGVVPVVFNPWLFTGRDDLLRGFFEELRHRLGEDLGEQAKGLWVQIDKYWNALSFAGKVVGAVVDANGASGMGSAAAAAGLDQIEKLKPGTPRNRSALEERAALESNLKSAKVAVVVLIDELDRIEDSEVRAVAQLIKAIGEIKGISYLVSYEPKRVADALGRGEAQDRIESGERYLEKIIQHPIPVRPLFSEDVEKLLTAAFSVHEEELPLPTNQQARVFEELKSRINTPREVKRLVGSFKIIQRSIRGEICPYDVLCYSWMSTRSPTLQKRIADCVDQLVDDPSTKEMSKRAAALQVEKGKGPDVIEILGPGAAAYEEILKLLFPRFGVQRDNHEQQGLRISRRHNLIRILYLGDPPSLVSKKQVEAIWSIATEGELLSRLSELKKEGKLVPLLDRLSDFIDELKPDGDELFWPTISRLLERDADWVNSPNTDRGIAEDVALIILRLGRKDKVRAKKIFESLVVAGELSVSAYIFRKHLFHYGLTKHSTRQRDDVFMLTERETRNLLKTEVERYRAAVESGRALKRLPNVEALYVISNVEAWDELLRESLTKQLHNANAISSLAALVVPPGYVTEKGNLHQLFDTDVVEARITDLGPPSAWVKDEWVRESTKRLASILRGKDPMFLDDEDD